MLKVEELLARIKDGFRIRDVEIEALMLGVRGPWTCNYQVLPLPREPGSPAECAAIRRLQAALDERVARFEALTGEKWARLPQQTYFASADFSPEVLTAFAFKSINEMMERWNSPL